MAPELTIEEIREKAIEMSDDKNNSIEDIINAFPETLFPFFIQQRIFLTTGGASKFLKEEHGIETTPANIRNLADANLLELKREPYRKESGAVETRYFTRAEVVFLAEFIQR